MQEQRKRHYYDIIIGKFKITCLEAEFLGVIGTKVLRVFLIATIHSHLY
jgi:hypothetical protein